MASSELPSPDTVCFLKIAQRPRFAMLCIRGFKPRIRQDIGPIDLGHSFAVAAPTAKQAKRVAKACRNLVRPLTFTLGSITWIDGRVIAPIRLLLRRYHGCLRVKEVSAAQLLRMFASSGGSQKAQQATDILMQRELAKRHTDPCWSVDPDGRRWVVYKMREQGITRCSRLKIGVSRSLRTRAKALHGRDRSNVHTYACRGIAYAVEQGLHGLLYSFQDRRPRRSGVHGGDTEWYALAAARFIDGAAGFFTHHVRGCVALLHRRDPITSTGRRG